MDKTTLNRSRDEVIAGLRSCAGSVAQISQALATQTAAEKFSFESEFLFFKREALLTKLSVPAQSQADSIPPTRPKNFEGFSGQEPDSPIRIAPVAQDLKRRPMWTVAVVASDPDPDFFPVLLASIITALAKSASWEILIADNASQTTDLAGIVREFSKFPVTVFRLKTPVDPADAANECIRRSRGEFIHVAAQDGIIAEGFYEQLGNGLRKFPEAELAASHNSFCDFEHVLHRPVPASELTGCYGNTNDAAIWAYRVPFSAMVARRSLYESLGGFHANLGLWAEWEMKARFLSASPIYFEKAELYFETLTSASRRQRILCEALDLELCSKAIARAAKYYPQASSAAFSETSAYLFAMEFAQFGCCLFSKDQAQAAMAHFQAAVRLCPQKVIFDTIKSRAFHLTAAQGEPMTLEDFTNGDAEELPLGDSPADFFPSAELKELETLIAAYQANPSDGAVLDQVRALRNGLCSHLLEAGDLEKLFAGNFAKIFSLVRESGLSAEDHGADEKILEGRAGGLLTAVSGDPRGLLAAMLLCPAHWATLPVEFSTKPDWLMGMYMDYMLASPQGFVHFGEPDMYRDHVEALLAAIERDIAQTPLTPTAKWAAFQTALRLNLIPAYFSRRDMKDLMRARARILAFFLQQNGYQLDAAFAPRPFHRKKIRVGFLSAHLGPQTETYTSVPSFYLDREKFEIQIFVLGNNPSAIETHCRSNSDSFTVLPPEAGARVEALRRAELDVLVIGTNMTAVTNDILILGMHRLAPIQIASSSSPMTPGLPHLDGFLSGIVHGYDAYTGQYNEPLVLIDGAISCLEYSVDRPTAVKSFTRGEFGIPEGVPLFVSGANFFKILPELQATWAKILNQVPGSYLLLHPFNPNWTNRYPIARFRRDICRAFERAGVDPNRVVISETVLPTRADVSRLMALGDVYLDSYPFSGSVSLVDPLEAGVPPVAWCAGSTRGLMAASMLSDLDLRELVAESEDEFVAKAVRLATEPGERERISRKIRSGMEAGPRFFDVKTYGREVGRVLEEIVLAERETEDVPDTGTLLARAQAALAAGRAGDTEDLCRILLERAPEDAGGWALLATLARRSGDLGYALDLTD